MKRKWIWFVLLILTFTLGIAFSAFALEKGELHPDPYKVMTKGQVIGQLQKGSSDRLWPYLLIAYQGEIYRLNDYGDRYRCVFIVPDIN